MCRHFLTWSHTVLTGSQGWDPCVTLDLTIHISPMGTERLSEVRVRQEGHMASQGSSDVEASATDTVRWETPIRLWPGWLQYMNLIVPAPLDIGTHAQFSDLSFTLG